MVQGGRASPLLYRIGANDLLTGLNAVKNTRPTAYADDTAIVTSGNSEEELKTNVKAAMRAVSEWAGRAEIKLNTSKTEIISIGRCRVSSLQIEDCEVRTSRSLKYLGVIIDDKLSWKEHVKNLTNKTDKLLLRVIPMCWTRGVLNLRDKLKLYRQVFLPMLTYGHEVWFKAIEEKKTLMESIGKCQRRILRAITGAYRCASTAKLLEITGELPIDVELKITEEANKLPREERTAKREELRRGWRSGQETHYQLSEKFDTGQIKSKETVWCLTETGPFKRFLKKIGKADDEGCRRCGGAVESAQHLLFECERSRPESKLSDTYDTREFEAKCIQLVRSMREIE